MATYKTLQNSSLTLSSLDLECDNCGSADIVDTRGGYVCRKCGLVLEVQKLQYDRPYNEEKLQHARGRGKTQIGNIRERRFSPQSRRLVRLNRQNSRLTTEEAVKEEARAEISRIFTSLDLSDYHIVKEMVFTKFSMIRPEFRPGLKYRNTKKLVATISYFCLKIQNVAINCQDLIENSNLTKKEFNDFCIQVRRYLPEYMERNRKDYIRNRLFEITEHFELGMPFYSLAGRILDKLWYTIKNTTDNVVAGLVSSISLLCNKIEKVSVSAICTRLSIRMSTIQAQVKKKIFKKFKVNGFISLIKSSNILVQIIEKLGLIEKREVEEEPEEFFETDDHVEIVFGNVEVFNSYNNSEYYYFALKSVYNTPVYITVDINDFPITDESQSDSEVKKVNLLECKIFSQYHSKGPPFLYVS